MERLDGVSVTQFVIQTKVGHCETTKKREAVGFHHLREREGWGRGLSLRRVKSEQGSEQRDFIAQRACNGAELSLRKPTIS